MSELKPPQRELCRDLESLWLLFGDLTARQRLAYYLAVARTMANGAYSTELIDAIIRDEADDE